MKTFLGIVIAALIGLNIYQYFDRDRLQSELNQVNADIEFKAELIAAPLRDKTEALTAKNASLESKIAALEQGDDQKNKKSVSASRANPMKAMAKAMEDNPAMQEMIAAQQSATLKMMYGRLYENLSLNDEELEHFQKLLTDAHMVAVENGMKMIGDLPKDERETLLKEIEASQEDLKGRVREFLNDSEDYDYYTFYTKTLNERMAMSSFQKMLETRNEPMDSDTEEALVALMFEKREAMDFEDNYHDQYEFDPRSMTQEKVDRYLEKYSQLEQNIANSAGDLLTSGQLEAFRENQKSARGMIEMGLNMTLQMFGGDGDG